MLRKKVLGLCLAAFGIGMFIGCLLSTNLIMFLIAFALIVLGFYLYSHPC